jgi:hypothetical protein
VVRNGDPRATTKRLFVNRDFGDGTAIRGSYAVTVVDR